LPPIRIL
jgi:hypothetical protein